MSSNIGQFKTTVEARFAEAQRAIDATDPLDVAMNGATVTKGQAQGIVIALLNEADKLGLSPAEASTCIDAFLTQSKPVFGPGARAIVVAYLDSNRKVAGAPSTMVSQIAIAMQGKVKPTPAPPPEVDIEDNVTWVQPGESASLEGKFAKALAGQNLKALPGKPFIEPDLKVMALKSDDANATFYQVKGDYRSEFYLLKDSQWYAYSSASGLELL
jgi:hypothetical protein